MDTPTVAWNERTPAGSDQRSEGYLRIQELKTQAREILAVDHEMASSGSSETTGYHNKLTFTKETASPAMAANTIMLFAKAAAGKTELWMDSFDSTTAEMQITCNGGWSAGMRGEVRIWSGTLANIPSGWGLCDGEGGRPELTNRFVKGILTDTTAPNTLSGGSESHIHTMTHAHTMPHRHTIPTHGHQIGSLFMTYVGDTKPDDGGGFADRVPLTSHIHAVTGSFYSAPTWGGSSTLTNTGSASNDTASTTTLPPYLELAYIVKL